MRARLRAGLEASALPAAYIALTLYFSWPLATRLTTSIAGDYGDSLFTTWVLAWVADHFVAILRGDVSAWATMWNAPIFAPEAGTLTYSEHFIGQTLQVLPLYWATYQPLLAFNLIFVATFALTGLAAHRLTHHLCRSHIAGAVAGVTCMFSDYRVIWSSQLHMLSVHWWLFALWGIDRYVATRSTRALVAAFASLVMLHLSSNYLMAFCAPFTAAFCLWSLARHGRLQDRRTWLMLLTTGLASVLVVLPLLLRYLDTREALKVQRPLFEIAAYSATIGSYRTALPWLGPLVALATMGAFIRSFGAEQPSRRERLALLGLASAAFVLSLGPVVQVGALTIPGPYRWLMDYVPGFAGLRVPDRFFAIALSMCSVLAGMGAAWLARWRLGLVVALVLVALAVRPAFAAPFMMNRWISTEGLPVSPEYLRPLAHPPAIYRFARTLPPQAVLAEFPFADLGYEIRFTYFTLAYGRRTLNGYSGVLPPSYLARAAVLRTPLADGNSSWAALAPATHVIVHTAVWNDDTGSRIRAWLESRGARAIAHADGAWLYELRPR